MKGSKYDGGKPAWHLMLWGQLEEVARVLTFGAQKYGPDNWKDVESGADRYFSAALRHLAACRKEVRKGPLKDEETGLPHYAHAICSILFAWWHERRDYELSNASKKHPRRRR